MTITNNKRASDLALTLAAGGFVYILWFASQIGGGTNNRWNEHEIFNITIIGYYVVLSLAILSVALRVLVIRGEKDSNIVQKLLLGIALIPAVHWLTGYLQ